jgi:signal transduction histidine kinase/CheY-like chemotaxis protein/HPt (histidine-containing phosphotransfer) domain-containing protein
VAGPRSGFAAQWPRWAAILGGVAATGAAIASWLAVPGPWLALVLVGAVLGLIGSLMSRPVVVPDAPAAGARAEENLQQLRAEIEKHKALERELTSAKQTAEAATMSKGEFLATMSHEIRTPLNGIIPLLDILLSSPMPPDQREYVQTAFGSAKQLLRIVDDILDYSKLEANKLELETVGINLKDVLEGVMRLMDKAAENKGLRLTLNLDPGVRLAVRGDPVRLRQILTNLLSNAIKFTERGSVSLTVTRRAETRSQHELRFEVRDTGVGIPGASAARLFQPFSQADASTTRTYGGTGLGLVICKRIVDLMGGQIGVESEPGRGSLFWFQIPMLKALGDIGARKRDINGARALLVTANPSQQRRLALALPSWGVMVVHAGNTQEAIAKLRAAAGRSSSWAFDLMVVDAGSIPSTVLALHRGVMRESALEDLRVVYLRGDEDLPAEITDSDRVRVLQRDSTDIELRQQMSRVLESEPRTVVAPTPVAPEPAPRTPALAPDAPIRGHVLLVEDNPVNRQVAQRLLALAGLTLDSAENGKEAVERLARSRYDAVLMDCQMPVMDGYTATRQIRANEAAQKAARLPIIAMTANAMVGDREKCLAAGMDDYLSKPLNRALLEDTLRRWLPAVPVGTPGPDSIHPTAPAAATAPVAQAAEIARRKSAAELIAAIGVNPAPERAAVAGTPSGRGTAAARPTLRELIQARTPVGTPPATTATAAIPAATPTVPRSAAPTPGAPAMPRPAVPARPVAPAAPRSAATSAPDAHASAATSRANGTLVAPAAPVLNREIVDDLREIMGEEFVALVRVFLEDAPGALQKLQQAVDSNDVDALVAPAHSLKSTSANLGALALSDIARTIEHGARQRNLADPRAEVAALGREFHRVEAALRGFLG